MRVMSYPIQINAQNLLNAYKGGLFPMAEKAEDSHFYWIDPELRGILPINDFHIPKKLKRQVLKFPYEVKINTGFEDVIENCAVITDKRDETWINEPIKELFIDLHHLGHAHSVEAWDGNRLVGGLYGLAIGGAFFGESMFSHQSDASKMALVHLVARLWHLGYELLDTQFTNPHLEQFGCLEIPRDLYKEKLAQALKKECVFYSNSSDSISSEAGAWGDDDSNIVVSFLAFLQSKTQTS